MANTLTGMIDFVPKTLIKSAEVDANFANLIKYMPVWHKFTLSYSDFNGAATSTAYATLLNLDPLESVLNVYAKQGEALIGGSLTGIDLNIGYSSGAAELFGPLDVFQAATTSAYGMSGIPDLPSQGLTTTVVAQLVGTGSTLDSLTAGSITVYVLKLGAPTS